MDWQAILTSTLISSTLIGTVLFFIKKTFAQGIETRFKRIENEQRLFLEEETRRNAKLYDDQYELFKSISELIYKTRNHSRSIFTRLNEENLNLDLLTDQISYLNQYKGSLETLLLNNKAILPEVIFSELHDLKAPLRNLEMALNLLTKKNIPESEQVLTILRELKPEYEAIDRHYFVIHGLIQAMMGIKK